MKEKIQSEALNALIKNESGTIVLSTGTGKSKVAIDYIKHVKPKKVLITSPRTTLKENWSKEIDKWLIESGSFKYDDPKTNIRRIAINGVPSKYQKGRVFEVDIVNIQTCYKWSEEVISEYDLIIMDKKLSM